MGLGILRRKRRSPKLAEENPHTISVSDGIAECKPHRWAGSAAKLQEHLRENPNRIVIAEAAVTPALQRPPEMDESRRAMLRAGALGALGIGGAYALSHIAQPAQAAPGDGISGVTIAPGSVDAKRIGGLYYAENYDK